MTSRISSAWQADLCGFDNLSGADAGRADSNRLMTAVYDRPDPAQIGIPASPGEIVSVADPVAVVGSLTA